jgi:ribosomal protein L37E
MLLWSIACFLGACSGMMHVANSMNGQVSNPEAAGVGIGLFFWMLVWFFPTAGMGIIALVSRPKPSIGTSSTTIVTLCRQCGRYFAGQAAFCPLCGKPPEVSNNARADVR